MWLGPIASVIMTKPEHIKEVLNRVYDFPKPPVHPIVVLFATGVVLYEGEKWSKHRRIINPSFHLEKLKIMVPAFYESCSEMISKWERLVTEQGSSNEIDVWPYLGDVTSNVISRTAFGSSYEESKRIFELQEEQGRQVLKALEFAFIPGMSFKKNQVSFLPFGWGPRFCPRQIFALMEAKIALVLILQRFSCELSLTYTHAPHGSYTSSSVWCSVDISHDLRSYETMS